MNNQPLASGFERLGIVVQLPTGAMHKYPTVSELCIVNLKTGSIRFDVENDPIDHEEFRAIDLVFYSARPSQDLKHLFVYRRDIVKNSVIFSPVTSMFSMDYEAERVEASYLPGGWSSVRSYSEEL